jgi:hypothetical protein
LAAIREPRPIRIGYRGSMIRSNADDDGALRPGSIERLAADWLAAEREVAAGIRNPAQAEETARELSAAYDNAIRAADRDQLKVAWDAARARQRVQVTGSEAWAEARRLSELLRTEYEATTPNSADAAEGQPGP